MPDALITVCEQLCTSCLDKALWKGMTRYEAEAFSRLAGTDLTIWSALIRRLGRQCAARRAAQEEASSCP